MEVMWKNLQMYTDTVDLEHTVTKTNKWVCQSDTMGLQHDNSATLLKKMHLQCEADSILTLAYCCW